MSLRNDITTTKQHGVVYTPQWIVEEMLNCYPGVLEDKQICDPACGDGNFLVAVVNKILDKITDDGYVVKSILEKIHGFDIDAAALEKCRERLTAAVRSRGFDIEINWQLICLDSVNKSVIAQYFGMFDFVVGNPPYIRIQNLPKETRRNLAEDWSVTRHGSADMYMAFFDMGLRLLNFTGYLCFITPNGYTKTVAGESLRKLLTEKKVLKTLIDFGDYQVFDNATTYSLITLLSNDCSHDEISLYRYQDGMIHFCDKIKQERLGNSAWDLCDQTEYTRLQNIRTRGKPLGEVADIFVGVQTLADDVFILEHLREEGDLLVGKNLAGEIVKLEKDSTLPIVKVSKMKNGVDEKNRVLINPYEISPTGQSLMTEDELLDNFPNTYAYLLSHKERLLQRDKGKLKYPWYAHGREINLWKTLGNKILTSGMNQKPNFMQCPNSYCTFYSGYAVKIKDNSIGEDALLEQLNSEDMAFFIGRTGRDYRDGWKSYTKTYIKDFGVRA